MESRDVMKASLLPMFIVKLCRVPHWVLMKEVFADYNIWNGALSGCREVWDKSCPSPEFRRVQIVSEIHAEHFWLECTLGSYRYVPWAAYKMSFQRQCHSLWVFFTFHFCTILLALISWHQCLWKPWHFWHRHRLTLVFSTISCRHPQLL